MPVHSAWHSTVHSAWHSKGCDCAPICPQVLALARLADTVAFMARVPRTSLPDGYFHVFARGIATAEPVFSDDEDRDTFVEIVWQTAGMHSWICHALCVMASHYHLVLQTRRESLSRGLHRVNWRYARHFNSRHARFGHVFAERFSARAIESEQYLFEACAYVLLNPVRAGLCARVEDWPWSYSSFGLTAT